MKKKLIATTCLLAIVASIVCVSPEGGVEVADASSIKTTAIADNFNAEAIDENKWDVSDGVEIQSYGGALQIYSGEFSPCITWLGTKFSEGLEIGLEDDYVLEFVMSRDAASWISVFVGLDTYDLSFSTIGEADGIYGNALVISNGGLVNYTKMAGIAQAMDGSGDSKLSFGMYDDGTRYAVKLVCDVDEDMSKNKLDFYYCKVDEAKLAAGEAQEYGEKVGTIDNVSLKGYFGFGSMSTGGTAYISDIKVSDFNGELIWKSKSDLKESAIDHIYGSSAADLSKEFRLWNSYAGEKVNKYTNGLIGEVRLKDEGSLISKEALVADDALITAYDFVSKVTVEEMGEGFEVILGKTDEGETALRFVSETLDEKAVTAIKYGEKTYYLGKDLSNGIYKLSLKVKTTNEADVYINGTYTLTVKGVMAIDGKLGFRTLSGASILVDNVEVTKFVLVDYATKSIAENFLTLNSNDAPVVNTSTDWYTAGNAFVLKGETLFVNADQSAYLATRQQYSDYVVKFTLTDIMQGAIGGVAQCSWIGFSVGKKSLSDNYAACQTIAFAPRGVAGDKVGNANVETIGLSLFEGGKNTISTDYNIFEDFGAEGSTHDALNVMLVVNNRTITLYYKYDDEPDSVLTVPRAVISDVDTDGYFAICTNYYGNFSVKNISVINLSTLEDSISNYENLPEDRQETGDASILG